MAALIPVDAGAAVHTDRGERWWRPRPSVAAPTQILHGVLSCETVQIPADGVIMRDWGAAFASIAVTHHGPSSTPVLIFAGGPVADTRPGGGPTTARLDPFSGATFALTGQILTVWGTAGDQVTLQAFTDRVPPCVGGSGVGGGGAGGGLTDAQLRAAAVVVRDDYAGGEVLADQAGAGAVLTFTFAAPVHLVVAQSTGTLLTSRMDPFGATPAASTGIRLDDGVPTYVPVTCTAVKVFAPAGATVAVFGLRRA